MFPIHFTIEKKKHNSTKRLSFNSLTCDCVLKEETSVTHPTILISGVTEHFAGFDFPNFSCAYIPIFHRYYYVVAVRQESADQWEIDLKVDVLATYKDEILATKAFIMYAQVGINPDIIDQRLPTVVTVNERVHEVALPHYSKTGSYTIWAVGGRGASAARGLSSVYKLTPSQASQLAYKLTDWVNWTESGDTIDAIISSLQELGKRFITEPINGIIAAMWTPFTENIGGAGTAPVWLGKYDAEMTAATPAVITDSITVPVEVPGNDTYVNDYRRSSICTDIQLFLPGAGFVDIAGGDLINRAESNVATRIDIDVTIDNAYGDVTYIVKNELGRMLGIYYGKLGVEIPVSANSINTGGYIQTIASGAALVFLTATAPETMGLSMGMLGAIGGLATGTLNSFRTQAQSGGAPSGLSAIEANSMVRAIVKYRQQSDEPANIPEVIGRPCYYVETLGLFHGYVKCTNCYPEIQCYEEEWEELDAMLNGQGTIMSGAKQGGIYIE